jgi:hypothetical protein
MFSASTIEERYLIFLSIFDWNFYSTFMGKSFAANYNTFFETAAS